MTCGGETSIFRLLDAIVGWEADPKPDYAKGLAGLDDPDGITLAPDDPGAVGAGALDPYLPPPWLVPGCGPCEWYLATPAGGHHKRHASQLLRLGACSCDWQPVWDEHCTALPGADIAAIAASGHRIAVADRASAGILLIEASGDRVAATIPLADVVAMTFTPGGTLVVAQRGQRHLLRFDPSGAPLEPFTPALPRNAQVERLGAGTGGSIFLATPAKGGVYHLWRAGFGDPAFVAATLADLAAARPRTALARATAQGFCISRPQATGEQRCCWSRDGASLDPSSIGTTSNPTYALRGQLLTGAIDSGVPRCIWHRVRIDADIPPGTSVAIAVATLDSPPKPDIANPSGPPPWSNDKPWNDFPGGMPHPLDWQEVSTNTDFLIRQPAGRYLYLRLRLGSQDGSTTPRVHRIRLDFPRVTSLDLLPPIYRQDPESADFTARFLALFDASIADLDNAIERAPALLDSGGVPDDVLPWLARFIGLALDPAWEPARRRAILRALPELYRRRGTLAGLKLAFRLVFDVEPAIEEMALARNWAAFDRRSRIGATRLFGRRRARAQIGRSALGATVLKSYGNPATDPLEALAYRIRILMPPASGRPLSVNRVQGLLDSQKPAHTIATLHFGGDGFVLGTRSAIGIDTIFALPPAPVLGKTGNVRLNRMTVLRRGRPGSQHTCSALAVGQQPLTE
jgi:phage tail-like protein